MRRFPCILLAVLAGGLTQNSVSADEASMRKQVTDEANFVVYAPAGWTATESTAPGCRTVVVRDPADTCEASLTHGFDLTGGQAKALFPTLFDSLMPAVKNLNIRKAYTSDDAQRIVCDGSYERPAGKPQAFRAWLCVTEGTFVFSRIEAPENEFDSRKEQLLTILANVRPTKDSLEFQGPAPNVERLSNRRLRDGSAQLLLPSDWELQDLGTCSFVATSPAEASCFMVASVDFLSPTLGVRLPGVLSSEYLPPHRALELAAVQTGLASDVKFEEVIPRPDLVREISKVYTAGPVQVEEFVQTSTSSSGVRTKGYSLGISFGSRLGTNWRLWHMTVSAPRDKFAVNSTMFLRMMQAYRIDDDFASGYIARGMQRLRELQAQTAALVARNAQEIHSMMQAAYKERQRSWDYIDYQRTNYIRGQQDWISSLEGGTIYHTDSWGTLNTDTGTYHQGTAYDYVHFQGENPRYLEMMTPIDSRDLWERFIR
jgi:hypothetical protein